MNNNEETFDLESILAKLSDLQHLANNAGTEGEAAAAAAVQRLLFKYNLSMADIGEKGEAGRAFERSDFTIGGDLNASTNKWKAHLLAVICAANFCGCVQTCCPTTVRKPRAFREWIIPAGAAGGC